MMPFYSLPASRDQSRVQLLSFLDIVYDRSECEVL